MSDCVWLLRHGDTEWTKDERRTGRRDIALSEAGREQARRVAALLAGVKFAQVLVSPQIRAVQTCRLAGLANHAVLSDHLVEWDYGEYEGLTDEQTQARAPDWDLFATPAPAERAQHRSRRGRRGT